MSNIKSLEEVTVIFNNLKSNEQNIRNRSISERKKKIKYFHDTMLSMKEEIQEALYKDLKRNATEVNLTEVWVVLSECRYILRKLKSWTKPKKVKHGLTYIGSKSYVHKEPKGTVLIMSPWNYPIFLSLHPLLSAVAAGNCVILKPSETTTHSLQVIKKLVNLCFEPNDVIVMDGGHETTANLLKLPFNHIFFTGSPNIGKTIMAEAAKNLTPVTLELGGKSPVVVDETAHIKTAATRIVWGKFLNAGQTCVAPDYVYVHESIKDKFIEEAIQAVKKMYGNEPSDWVTSTSYARIISERHTSRLHDLIQKSMQEGASLDTGGECKLEDKYIAPTILSKVTSKHTIMQDEIFGPILPILTYNNISDVLKDINSRPLPLAFYIFSRKNKNIKHILANTKAGGGCINDTILHVSQHKLPFGGIGNSGMGKSNGIYGFEVFTNLRSTVYQSIWLRMANLVQAPYTPFKHFLSNINSRWF